MGESYSVVLLAETSVLSSISPFYHDFENLSFFTVFNDFRTPRAGGGTSEFCRINVGLRIGPCSGVFLGGGPKGYVKIPNLFTPLVLCLEKNSKNCRLVTDRAG